MLDRYIYHIDINHCFAQIEEMMNPKLKEVPMCVGGDEKTRSGIVLARNLKAKEYGIKTAETLREALRKCPDLVIVPSHYKEYIYYTNKVKDIYKEYTDLVESYGLDEAWLDVTRSYKLFGKPFDLPKIIQDRVYEEIGLTVSVGVSWNKIFAKLGSDMIKPSGLVYIAPYNFKEVVWTLPAEDLLFVGQKTKEKLNSIGIFTIGDIANADIKKLKKHFGVKGLEMYNYANGLDTSEVKPVGYVEEPKSIGNGFTPPKDMITLEETKVLMTHLVDGIASRLREAKKMGDIITIAPRDINLKSFTRRKKISSPTDSNKVILDTAVELLNAHYDFDIPLRSISIQVSGLVDAQNIPEQISIFDEINEDKKDQETIEKTIEELRERFGYHVVKRASALLDKATENLDVKKGNVVYPGRSKDIEDK